MAAEPFPAAVCVDQLAQQAARRAKMKFQRILPNCHAKGSHQLMHECIMIQPHGFLQLGLLSVHLY